MPLKSKWHGFLEYTHVIFEEDFIVAQCDCTVDAAAQNRWYWNTVLFGFADGVFAHS